MNDTEKYAWDNLQKDFNHELTMLLEKAMPNIGGNVDTFIIEPICNLTREKLDISIISHKEGNTIFKSEEYLSEEAILKLLDNTDIYGELQENKEQFIEKLEQARDVKKFKKALGTQNLLCTHKDIDQNIFFSVHQTPSDIGYLDRLKSQGMNREKLRQAYIFKEISNERKIVMGYLTTSSNVEWVDYVDTIKQIQKNKVNIKLEKIKPLLAMLLEKTYDEKQTFLFSQVATLSGANIIFGVAINEEYSQAHSEVFDQNNMYINYNYTSFILEIIKITLDKWSEIFQHRLYNKTSKDIMNYSATLQLAARDMTEGRGLPPYSYFNLLSSMAHESSSCYGKIAFILGTEDEKKLNKKNIEFDTPIQIIDDNIRYIRKILEISGEKYYLICTTDAVIGLAELTDTKKLHILKFDGFMKWTLEYNGVQLLSYDKENLFYKTDTYKEKIKNMEQTKDLKSLIRKLCEQKQGTMVIIFQDASVARAESERFSTYKRGIELKNPYDLSLDNDMALRLSSIDGALIIDEKCMCYGIGIIVDGKACVRGSQSRGSRYNSAKNYVESMNNENHSCIACVISEDRTLDIITSRE